MGKLPRARSISFANKANERAKLGLTVLATNDTSSRLLYNAKWMFLPRRYTASEIASTIFDRLTKEHEMWVSESSDAVVVAADPTKLGVAQCEICFLVLFSNHAFIQLCNSLVPCLP